MKKIVLAFLVVAVLALGFVGALSVVPHAHGNDFDHSTHKSCPIYQFSLHAFGATIAVFQIAGVSLFLFYLLNVSGSFPIDFSYRFNSLRAPPLAV